MRTSDFDYRLPDELIAQHPASERGASRLLHLDAEGSATHRTFAELPGLLRPDDLLVRNITRVIPARICARREPGGGRVEVLVLPKPNGDQASFQALTRPALRPGTRLLVAPGVVLEVGDPLGGGRRRIEIVRGAAGVFELADKHGETPLPPYVRRDTGGSESAADDDRERYQTVYARTPGSVAAPTAGLHFDEAMFARLAERGVEVADLTLHVGYGTFMPVRSDDPREHSLAAEAFEIPAATRRAIREQLETGRRVVAVGTTTVRVLETPGVLEDATEETPARGETSLLILPGHPFRVVSALLTNFHLPQSSLLMLVAALGGTAPVLDAYRQAVEERYRFYSYGDAMLVERATEPSHVGYAAAPGTKK